MRKFYKYRQFTQVIIYDLVYTSRYNYQLGKEAAFKMVSNLAGGELFTSWQCLFWISF